MRGQVGKWSGSEVLEFCWHLLRLDGIRKVYAKGAGIEKVFSLLRAMGYAMIFLTLNREIYRANRKVVFYLYCIYFIASICSFEMFSNFLITMF